MDACHSAFAFLARLECECWFLGKMGARVRTKLLAYEAIFQVQIVHCA